MQNPLKFLGVPQTGKPISAVSGLKFAILWGHMEEILLFNKFFSDCRYMPTRYGDGAGNTAEENSSVFSPIRMR